MQAELLQEKEAQELVKQAEVIERDFQGYQIINNDAYAFAGEHLKKIKSLYSEVDAKRKSMTSPLDEAKKRIMDFFRVPLDKLTKVEGNIKGAMLTFQRQQEEIRRKEEARLQELARREEEKRKKALEERAKKAEAKGDLAKAEELLQKKEEVFVPAPIVESQVQKVEGVKTMKVWKFRIVNEAKIPRDYLCVDEKKIGAVAKATKGTLKIEGVEIYSEDVISSGRF